MNFPKIYYFFSQKTLAMPNQMCYTIITVRETEPNINKMVGK